MKSKFIFLIIIFLLHSVESFSQETENYGLIVSGKVNDVEMVEAKNYVGITAKAEMKIVNNNQHTVILVDPNFYYSGLVSFALTEQESKANDVYRSAAYPTSSFFSKDNEKLAKGLDSNKPPSKYVVILNAGQSFTWKDDIYTHFNKTPQYVLDYSAEWKTVKADGDKFWLSFIYRLPSEINYFKPNLIEKLPMRWKKYGVFPISCSNDEDCDKKDFKIKTEPIFIDLSKAKMKQSSKQ